MHQAQRAQHLLITLISYVSVIFVFFAGAEVTTPGKRGADIKLNGGEILLDGQHFREKPQEAVTIALWVNLWRTGGVHSMFDTIGGHSIHNKGQYHFEVFDGRVRWFHRNEYAQEIFHIRTPPILQPNLWYHIVATYDSRTHLARVFVNGDLVGEGHGSGLLSLDWEAKAGFGSHSGRRILLGYMDEIYIFRRALQEKELDRYLENPKSYSQPQSNSDLINSESYSDSFSHMNTNSVWFSQPYSHLTDAPFAKPNSALHYEDQMEGPTNARTTGSAIVSAVRPPSIPSKESQTTPMTTTKEPETTTAAKATEKHNNQSSTVITTAVPPTTKSSTIKPTLPKIKPTKSTNSSVHPMCKKGNVYRDRDLVGGLGAGNFTDKGPVRSIDECMDICCGFEECSVAYMVENNCFAISCKEDKQCKTFVKSPMENTPVVGFIERYKPGGKICLFLPELL